MTKSIFTSRVCFVREDSEVLPITCEIKDTKLAIRIREVALCGNMRLNKKVLEKKWSSLIFKCAEGQVLLVRGQLIDRIEYISEYFSEYAPCNHLQLRLSKRVIEGIKVDSLLLQTEHDNFVAIPHTVDGERYVIAFGSAIKKPKPKEVPKKQTIIDHCNPENILAYGYYYGGRVNAYLKNEKFEDIEKALSVLFNAIMSVRSRDKFNSYSRVNKKQEQALRRIKKNKPTLSDMYLMSGYTQESPHLLFQAADAIVKAQAKIIP